MGLGCFDAGFGFGEEGSFGVTRPLTKGRGCGERGGAGWESTPNAAELVKTTRNWPPKNL